MPDLYKEMWLDLKRDISINIEFWKEEDTPNSESIYRIYYNLKIHMKEIESKYNVV